MFENFKVKGLYLAGQDVITGGFASAMSSGIYAAESILGYHKFTCIASGRSLIKDLNKMDGYKDTQKGVDDYDFDVVKQKISQNE